jgi:hypothetical protein
MGLTRQRVGELYREGKINPPGRLPGGKQPRFDDTRALDAWIKEWKKGRAQRLAKPRATRWQRRIRRRELKIAWLVNALKSQREVDACDKGLALGYLRGIAELNLAKRFYPPRTPPRFPLLETIQAVYEGGMKSGCLPEAVYDFQQEMGIDIESAIERLPVRPEATLQTEQSSLKASD